MQRTSPQDRFDRARALLQASVLAVVVLGPLPFGSVQPWAVLALELACAGLFVGAAATVLRHHEFITLPPRFAMVGAISVLGIGALQLIPLPPSAVRLVAPHTASLREEVVSALPDVLPAWLPISLSPADSLDALLRLSGYVALGFAAAVAFAKDPAGKRRFMVVVALSGAFQALYGAGEYLTGHQHIFGYAKRYYLDSATGTFINRNHFAGYLALCLPMALGLLAGGDDSYRRIAGWRLRTVAFIHQGGTIRLFGFAAAALMWIGIFASYSRAGLAAALVATALAVFGASRPRVLALALLACLLPALYLSWLEVRAPGERFIDNAGNIATLSGRLPAWRTAGAMVTRQPVLGYGVGTFESAFQVGQPADLTGRWDHAHNDWLQAVVEGGLVTGVVLAGLAVGVAVASRRRYGTRPRSGRTATYLTAGLGAAAFHALFDFGLRIPAVGALFAIQAGILAGEFSEGAPPDQVAAYRRRMPGASAPRPTKRSP